MTWNEIQYFLEAHFNTLQWLLTFLILIMVLIVRSLVRKRLNNLLVQHGYEAHRAVLTRRILNFGVYLATISSLILSFISLERIGYISIEIVVLMVGLIALLLLVQSKWIDRKLSYLINRALNRYTTLEVRDYYSLLHLSDNYRVSEIKVEQQDWLADKTLNDLQLHDEGILVLGIKRSNGEYIGAPRGETKIYNDDTVILYGRAALLESLDDRQKGQSGDKKHAEAVLEQERMWASQ